MFVFCLFVWLSLGLSVWCCHLFVPVLFCVHGVSHLPDFLMCLFKVSVCLSSLLYHTVILLPCPGCISVCFTWTLFSAGVFVYMLCLNKRSDIFCSLNLFDSLHFGSFIHTGLICRQNAPCITPPQVPTIDTWASELDQTAVEECGLVWWIKCSSITWMAECVCVLLAVWEESSRFSQCNALGNAGKPWVLMLLRLVYLPKHYYRPACSHESPPFHGNGIHWCLWPLSVW